MDLNSESFIFHLYKKITGHESKKLTGVLALILFTMLFPLFISVRDYNQYVERGKPCEIIILQPNINPYSEKFDGMSKSAQVEVLIHLTDSLLTDSTDYVVGPETTLPAIWKRQACIIIITWLLFMPEHAPTPT